MDIVWSEPARHDLREIFEYVAEDNVNAARKLLTEINERVLLLANSWRKGNKEFPLLIFTQPWFKGVS